MTTYYYKETGKNLYDMISDELYNYISKIDIKAREGISDKFIELAIAYTAYNVDEYGSKIKPIDKLMPEINQIIKDIGLREFVYRLIDSDSYMYGDADCADYYVISNDSNGIYIREFTHNRIILEMSETDLVYDITWRLDLPYSDYRWKDLYNLAYSDDDNKFVETRWESRKNQLCEDAIQAYIDNAKTMMED